MPAPPSFRPQTPAVLWLATCATLLGGFGSCTLIAYAMNADLSVTARTSGPLLGLGLVLWWLSRANKSGNQLAESWSWVRRRRSRKVELKFTRAREATASVASAGGPPTAESIRELRDGANTWVPSETRRPNRNPTRSNGQ